MDITVRCASEIAEDELRSLNTWLIADRNARRHVRSELGSARPAMPGHQGDGIDILSLVLSTGFSGASLAVSIATWRATRPKPPALVLERSDGTTVEITGHSPEEAAQLMRRLLGE
ncbi:hypothetical protein ACFXKX_23075 [Streptomyces scopuliridis]|uniref:effector-associated constant component EACC1 n=1 Tax=Streptomyces scopuliridis TaxID=452529 RepID=UPI0036C01909